VAVALLMASPYPSISLANKRTLSSVRLVDVERLLFATAIVNAASRTIPAII
jgi:hypothetical protein